MFYYSPVKYYFWQIQYMVTRLYDRFQLSIYSISAFFHKYFVAMKYRWIKTNWFWEKVHLKENSSELHFPLYSKCVLIYIDSITSACVLNLLQSYISQINVEKLWIIAPIYALSKCFRRCVDERVWDVTQ